MAGTVLHTPPEGFKPPLALALVRARQGWMSLAHLAENEIPVAGSGVELNLQKGLYQARPVPDAALPWLKTRQAWRRLPTKLRLMRRRLSKEAGQRFKKETSG